MQIITINNLNDLKAFAFNHLFRTIQGKSIILGSQANKIKFPIKFIKKNGEIKLANQKSIDNWKKGEAN